MKAQNRKPFDTDFDGQRLMYHPKSVAFWLREKRTTGPIYTEMELSTRCNCHCSFCGVSHIVNGPGVDISVGLAKRAIDGLHAVGCKSVMFSGHGEPLMNPDAEEIIAYASRNMSTSLTTNGLHLNEQNIGLIDGLEWIRFSINAGSRETYARVHEVSARCFDRVLDNVRAAVARKRNLGLKTTIGAQMVLLEDNVGEIMNLAILLKQIGVDYFSIKPYSAHPLNPRNLKVEYCSINADLPGLHELATENFRIIYRAKSMEKLNIPKPYGACHGCHFITFVSADGGLWACNVFVGDERFRIGNAADESIPSIWNGERRRRVMSFIEKKLDVQKECRDVCRMDECNRYLWRLRCPSAHDNFI